MTTIKTLNENGAKYFAGITKDGKVRWSGYRSNANEFKHEKAATKAAIELKNFYKVNTPLSVVKDAD